MRTRKPSSDSNDKLATQRRRTEVLDSGWPLVPSVEFASFPADVSHLVGEYLPLKERSYVETAFAGVQPITLCLSQVVGSNLASCWSIGFLPPNCKWKPSVVKIDKEYQITDFKGCLQLLEQEDSDDCQIAIEVLVVKLSETLSDFPNTLYDLRITIEELKHHLSSVKHVVFSIKEHASCCFTLNDARGKVEEMRRSVDHSKEISEIIDDLHTCWNAYQTLTVHELFAFYFKSGGKPASEKYLAKFVIPLNSDLNRKLFNDEASKMLSTKIMWVCSFKSFYDFIYVDQNTTRLCHAFHFDMCVEKDDEVQRIRDLMSDALFFKDNRFIERIVIYLGDHDGAVKLPQPSAPLTDATPRSALIELSLEGAVHVFDLTQLNNGYFPHLERLTVDDGFITGSLDSHCVPRLKTLSIEIFHHYPRNANVDYFLPMHTQAIVDTDRPWQLVASQDQRGWSLASYDEATPNPQDDGKEDASKFRPIIRELILVMGSNTDANEFQSRLNSNLSPEVAANDQNNGLLVWAPDRVEKITAYCITVFTPKLEFKETIPGKPRLLDSLICHGIDVAIDGAALPLLQSLELNGNSVELSGAFSKLHTVFFRNAKLKSPWEVNAPLLETLNCESLEDGNKLSLRPQLLPHLSYLDINFWGWEPAHFPAILFDENGLGLSRITHVVFGGEMSRVPSFNQCQMQNVLRLELTVDAWYLPACWESEWQCETLTINLYTSRPHGLRKRGITVIKMPRRLPCVKKLTVTEEKFPTLLDSKMLELIDCTVPSFSSLGPNLCCPQLRYICYTGKLSESDKEKCLNPNTYVAIGAKPRWVYFEDSGEVHRMLWDSAPHAAGESSIAGPLEEVD